MTIGSNIAASGPFFPNGVTTQFPFEIEIDFATDISVVWVSTDGSETLIPSAAYTVQISNTAPGGTVTFAAPPVIPNAGDQLWIVLDPEFEQQYRFSDEGPFNQSLLEGAVDSNVRLSIWLRSRIGRALLAPFGENIPALPGAAQRALKYLAFDNAGMPIMADPSAGSMGALAAALAAAGGAALVGQAGGGTLQTYIDAGAAAVSFANAGQGAVVRSARDRLRETISVKDYGAVGDGTLRPVSQWVIPGALGRFASFAALQAQYPHVTATSDSIDWAATQAAINHASTIGEGAEVEVPAGGFVYNRPVSIVKSGVRIFGQGGPATWMINATTNQAVLDFGDGVTSFFRNAAKDMIFGQASGVTPISGNCAIRARTCGQLLLDGISTFQFPARLHDGIVFDRVTQTFLNAIGVQGCNNRGIFMTNQTLDIYMNNGRCDDCAIGIEWRDCQGIQGSNWTAYGNSINAYRFTTSGSSDNNQFFFLTNFIGDTSGQHNWNIEQLSLSTFTNCWAATQLVPITGGNFDGFFLNGQDVEEIAFNGCIAVSNNRHGMNIAYANRIQINGGFYGSSFKPSAFGGLGARNGLAGAGSGIVVGALADRISIKGGKAENNASWGVDVVAGATKVEIEGIETRFNISGSIRNNANASAPECRIRNVPGFNPFGFINAPAVPASNTTITNRTGVDVMVYLTGGTLTGNVQINGHGVAAFTNIPYFLPAGGTIRLTYSSAPGWAWHGN